MGSAPSLRGGRPGSRELQCGSLLDAAVVAEPGILEGIVLDRDVVRYACSTDEAQKRLVPCRLEGPQHRGREPPAGKDAVEKLADDLLRQTLQAARQIKAECYTWDRRTYGVCTKHSGIHAQSTSAAVLKKGTFPRDLPLNKSGTFRPDECSLRRKRCRDTTAEAGRELRLIASAPGASALMCVDRSPIHAPASRCRIHSTISYLSCSYLHVPVFSPANHGHWHGFQAPLSESPGGQCPKKRAVKESSKVSIKGVLLQESARIS